MWLSTNFLPFATFYVVASISAKQSKIVGGRNAAQGEFPWMLSFQKNGSGFAGHVCGASLVEVEGIQVGVTAGHCIEDGDMTFTNYTLVAGELDFDVDSGIEQTQRVVKIVTHPSFINLVYHDIALIFVERNFTLSNATKPISLPAQGQETIQGNLSISGWGRLSYNGELPKVLQAIELPVFNHTACEIIYYNYLAQVQEYMICAGDDTDRYPCHGDSGGPAVSDAGYLAGINSWGYTAGACGKPGYPAVFTEVSYYVDWIKETVAEFKNNYAIET